MSTTLGPVFGRAAGAPVRNTGEHASGGGVTKEQRIKEQENRARAYARRWTTQHLLKGIPKTDKQGNAVTFTAWSETDGMHQRSVERYDAHLGCGRRQITTVDEHGKRDEVTVHSTPQGRAYYKGVLTCGMFWYCSACTAVIRRKRAADIKAAATRWLGGWDQSNAVLPYRTDVVKRSQRGTTWSQWQPPVALAFTKGGEAFTRVKAHREGGRLAFLTLTIPHSRRQSLELTLGFVMAAWSRIVAGRQRGRLRDLGMEHSIRAIEITYGDTNGFHPHVHVLLFLTPDADLAAIEEAFYEGWAAQVDKDPAIGSIRTTAGRKHSIRLDEVTKAEGLADYLSKVEGIEGGAASKSDISLEMARGDLKNGRTVRNGKGRKVKTHAIHEIVDLLTDHLGGVECGRCGGGDDTCVKYLRGVAVFREYVEATFRRQAIVWSPGLAKLLDIDDTTDAKAAAAEGATAADLLMGTITDLNWCAIIKYRGQGKVLEAAEDGGLDAMNAVVAAYRARWECAIAAM